MSNGSSVAAGVLLVIAGIWVLLQTIAGNLAGRLIGLAHPTPTGTTPSRGGTKTAPGGNAPWWEWMLAHGVP